MRTNYFISRWKLNVPKPFAFMRFLILALAFMLLEACGTNAFLLDQEGQHSGLTVMDQLRLTFDGGELKDFEKGKTDTRLVPNQARNNPQKQSKKDPKEESSETIPHFRFEAEVTQTFYDAKTRQFLVWLKHASAEIIDGRTLEIRESLDFLGDADLLTVGAGILVSYSKEQNILRFFDLESFENIKTILSPTENQLCGMVLDPRGTQMLLVTNERQGRYSCSIMDLETADLSSLKPESFNLGREADPRYLGQMRATEGFHYISFRIEKTLCALLEFNQHEGKIDHLDTIRWRSNISENGLYFDQDIGIANEFYGIKKSSSNQLVVGGKTGNFYLRLEPQGKPSYEAKPGIVNIKMTYVNSRDLEPFSEQFIQIPVRSLMQDHKKKIKLWRDIYDNMSFFINENERLLSIQIHRDLAFYQLEPKRGSLKRRKSLLVVLSSKPPPLQFGENLKWPIETVTGQKKLRYEVVIGPPGLKVNQKGVVTWKKNRKKEKQVLIRITNDGGGETYYAFKI